MFGFGVGERMASKMGHSVQIRVWDRKGWAGVCERLRVGISDALFTMGLCCSVLAAPPSILPRERPMGVLRARQEDRLYGGKKKKNRNTRNGIKYGKFFWLWFFPPPPLNTYIIVLCSPLVPLPLERHHNFILGTSCQV